MAPGPTVPRVRILGEDADAATIDEVMTFTEDRVLQGLPTLIANHNLHSLRLIRREPEMAAFYAMADLIEVDSTPLVAWARLLGRPMTRARRATRLDRREMFWRRAPAWQWPIFYLANLGGR